jgi:hypothetical protein
MADLVEAAALDPAALVRDLSVLAAALDELSPAGSGSADPA